MVGGKVRNPEYSAPLRLYGKNLPWVKHATHLGHELHENCCMDMDINIKRSMFITKSSEIRNTFHFAMPQQMLKAIEVYASHFYGSMLWDLYGNMAGQTYRSWNTCVKLVENLLSCQVSSVRCNILSQYVGFVKKLANSRSSEIRLLCRVAASDIRSTLSKNCRNVSDEFGINPWVDSPKKIRFNYKYYSIPEMDSWRIPLMNTLLRERFELDAMGEETCTVNELIASLCST